MKSLVFKRSECRSYKDFYEKVYFVLGKDIPDALGEYENLCYDADLLDEYLWYFHDANLHFVFIGFDLNAIKTKKPYENYEWSLIFEVVNEFCEKYSNNKVEYFKDE